MNQDYYQRDLELAAWRVREERREREEKAAEEFGELIRRQVHTEPEGRLVVEGLAAQAKEQEEDDQRKESQ